MSIAPGNLAAAVLAGVHDCATPSSPPSRLCTAALAVSGHKQLAAMPPASPTPLKAIGAGLAAFEQAYLELAASGERQGRKATAPRPKNLVGLDVGMAAAER